MLMSTGMATTGVADIGNDITEPDTTFPKLPHCLHTTNGDNPDRGIVPSYIVCFSILDAYRTRGCPYMAYRIRIDGTAQRQCKSMPDKLVRCKRSYPLSSSCRLEWHGTDA